MEIDPFERPEWEPVPREGCRNVEARVLLARPGVALVLLRFGRDATIDRHPAPHPIEVFCLEGEGYVAAGDESSAIRAGQRVLWPPNVPHQLWTEDSTMLTLMFEQPPAPQG